MFKSLKFFEPFDYRRYPDREERKQKRKRALAFFQEAAMYGSEDALRAFALIRNLI